MVDKTMMGDKCAELVRAAMIGALAVTLGNPTAVYAAEEETADPGQIGIEIAGEAAVGAASFCVEDDAAEEAPAEAEEVTEPEGTQNDEMEEESGSEGKEDETVPEEPEPQEPDGRENAGMTEPGKTGETEPEGPENAEPGEAGETEPEEPENPEPGDQGDMPETPGNSEMDGSWPGEGEALIFSAPAALRTTSNSVFSSAAAPASAAGPATTAAAAETPNSSSTACTSSESSRTVRPFNSSTIAVTFSDAMIFTSEKCNFKIN